MLQNILFHGIKRSKRCREGQKILRETRTTILDVETKTSKSMKKEKICQVQKEKEESDSSTYKRDELSLHSF